MVVEVVNPNTEEFAPLETKREHDFGDMSILCAPTRDRFLVSFLVDARGGSMRGSRHPGLRVLVPPSAASAPTRVTCRMLRPERTTRPPQLNDSEGLACRIIELGPHPCTFNSPVLLEIPHFAALRGRQRELVVLRSDNGETWREHSLEATDQAVQSALGQSFDALETLEELREKRIIRILTNDFPQYLAVVSRMRQETAMVGSDGGVLSSTVVPQVQAVFPEGALQKRIRVGLQAHPIPPEMVVRLLGNRVAVSPIVTLEPRRRKFHKPITLTIPLPKSAMRGMLNPAAGDLKTQSSPSLRLLCSITGGTLPAQWEDITGSTPLSKVKDCVSFTTTVSARFWLMDCQTVHDSTELAGQLYHEASLVPYMGKFVVFTKRLDADEALIRCFCVTDDKVDKTLECQEGFEVCAASPEVEVVEGRPAWLEAAGNLLPMAKSGEQLSLQFNAFRENRLAFPVRVRDVQTEQTGKFAFMRESRSGAIVTPDMPANGESPQKPICTLEVNIGMEHGTRAGANSTMADLGLFSLSDQLNTSAGASMHSIPCVFPQPADPMADEDVGLFGSENRLASVYASDVIARSQLDLLQVASEVGADWPRLVGALLPESHLDTNCTVEQLVHWVKTNEPLWQEARGESVAATGGGGFGGLTVAELRTDRDQALAVLLAWKEKRGDAATGNELDRALRSIGRMDVVKSCMRDIRCVTEEDEHHEASKQIDNKYSQPQQHHDDHHSVLMSAEPASTSMVGTVTLMSGMEDLPADGYGGAIASSDSPQVPVDVVVPDHISAVAEVPVSIVSDAVEEIHQPTEESSAIMGGHDQTRDSVLHEDEEDADAVGQYGEDQWASGSPPASSTSQQGGDPLLVTATQELLATDADADMVRESESMTGSLDGPTETGEEEQTHTEDVIDQPIHNSAVPEVLQEQTIDESYAQPSVSGMDGGLTQDTSNLDMVQGDPDARSPSVHSGELLEGSTAVEQTSEEHLADAHHDGGERPTSAQLAAPVKYFSEEAVELVEEGAVHDLAENQATVSEAQPSTLSTAHHGIAPEEHEH